MTVRRINNIWVIQCYNYLSLITDKSEIKNEMDFHEFIKDTIKDYFTEKPEKPLFNFIDYDFLMFIYNAVKKALYEGIIEQPFEAYHTDSTDTVILKIDTDYNVRILIPADEEDTFIDMIEPLSLDTLECFDNTFIQQLSNEINDSYKKECINKASTVRKIVKNDFAKNLSDAELNLILSEGMLQELNK